MQEENDDGYKLQEDDEGHNSCAPYLPELVLVRWLMQNIMLQVVRIVHRHHGYISLLVAPCHGLRTEEGKSKG